LLNRSKSCFTYAGSVDKAKELEAALSSVTQIKDISRTLLIMMQHKKLVDDVMAEFGQIDILINNAGITRDNLMLRMSKEDWDTIIKVNLDSVFNLTKRLLSQ
jgi:3-oxoacyl-[acyl-carrier protein] reductase